MNGITAVCSLPENGQLTIREALTLFAEKVAGEIESEIERTTIGAGLRAGWHSAVAGPLFRLPPAQDYRYGPERAIRYSRHAVLTACGILGPINGRRYSARFLRLVCPGR